LLFEIQSFSLKISIEFASKSLLRKRIFGKIRRVLIYVFTKYTKKNAECEKNSVNL
jgi:hypothetical protein